MQRTAPRARSSRHWVRIFHSPRTLLALSHTSFSALFHSMTAVVQTRQRMGSTGFGGASCSRRALIRRANQRAQTFDASVPCMSDTALVRQATALRLPSLFQTKCDPTAKLHTAEVCPRACVFAQAGLVALLAPGHTALEPSVIGHHALSLRSGGANPTGLCARLPFGFGLCSRQRKPKQSQ